MRDAVQCLAAHLTGRAGHGRGKALLGLSWYLRAQIHTHHVWALPNHSLQQACESWGSPTLKHWGS